ncbi:MAG: DsbE family thiol:disulfide interchange protein [Legionella sp.]|nr:DsbE family thiol:disulfide interchange protein [Legionella sp.]
MKQSLRFIPIVFFIVLGIFLWRGLYLDPHHLPSVQVGKVMPSFNLPQLQDPKKRFDNADFKGQVVLLNVWASWCEACIQEQVFLMHLARQGELIYGLNYKDKAANARLWLQHWGNPYHSIGQDLKGTLAIDLGVYGAPETFIIDKKGIIRYRQVGIMTQAVWKKQILPLMSTLRQET